MPCLRHDDSSESCDEDEEEMDEIDVEEGENEMEEGEEEEEKEEEDAAANDKDDAEGEDEEEEEEMVQGATEQEIGLLPRILERLQEPDFVANTTLFELQSISRLILRLEDSSLLQGTDLVAMVQMVKRLFAQSLLDFESNPSTSSPGVSPNKRAAPTADSPAKTPRTRDANIITSVGKQQQRPPLKAASKDPQTTLEDVPLRLTGMLSENESAGEGITHYTIFSAEEQDGDIDEGEGEQEGGAVSHGYTVNDHVTRPLVESATSDSPCQALLPPPATAKRGFNLAIIVAVLPKNEETDEVVDSTALAELSNLSHVLDGDYSFDTAVVIDDDLSAEVLKEIVSDSISMSKANIERLFIYLYTPGDPRSDAAAAANVNTEKGTETCMPTRNYALSFPSDNSSISHREILEAAFAAAEPSWSMKTPQLNHAVLVHDTGSSLQVLSALPSQTDESTAPILSRHVAVTLSEAAMSVANTSRCWLYDGLFTPIVVEMLTVGVSSNPNPAPGICAEDFVNYATTALSCKEGLADHALPRVGRCISANDAPLATVFLSPTTI